MSTIAPTSRVRRAADSLVVTLDTGAAITFRLEGDRLLGIADVTRDGIPLRNPAVLWRPTIATTGGIQYPELRLRTVRDIGDSVEVVCDAHGFRTRILEEQDEYLCELLDIGIDAPIVDTLTWILAPSRWQVGGRRLAGFSYRYRWQSSDPDRRTHRLFDFATWEVGGHVDGNTLLFQGQLNPPATPLTREGYFTTACNYYGAQMQGRLGPADRVSMQRLPRIATIQAFDMLVHDRGVLVNRFEPVEEVMTLVQKEEGEDCLHVVDELRRPLTGDFFSHPKHVLFLPTPEPLPRHESRNLWKQVLDAVHDAERQREGIARSAVLPRVWVPQIGGDTFQLAGRTGPRDAHLRFLADEVMPRWADMGVRQICAPSLWRSDYTELRFACKNDTGMHGGLMVSGICCVHDHVIADLYGGPAALAHFVDRAHAHGIEVQLWWATHLSRRAPVFREHPDWMIHSRDDQPGCGGIGNQVIIPFDLQNPACLEWEFERLRAVREATGVDGFFHDSYGNYGFLPVNYRDPLRRAQQTAYAELVRRLQSIGLRSFTVEGLGPWGVGHFGMSLIPTGPGAARGYQNALDWWLGEEDMMAGLNMGIGAPVWPDAEAARWFAFRVLAGGGRFGFSQTAGGVEAWTGWWRDLNRLHARLADDLAGERQLLPEDRGVLWRTPSGDHLLFAFGVFDHVLAGARVLRVTGDGEQPLPRDAVLRTEPWTVYRLT